MARASKNSQSWKSRPAAERFPVDEWGYPSGTVWCPMKMSGMALMKCAELQKQHGCGSLRQLKLVISANPGAAPLYWPWLRRGRECPDRAGEKAVRELRLAVSQLKPVEKIRKNPRAYHCPACGGRKAFEALRCRRCWRLSVMR
jgi:hypothetical protein